MVDNRGENLVFLLSIPRSGSTLLGMMLGSHPECLCPPEPWIQLALAELSPSSRISLPYDHYTATMATGEFISNITASPVARLRVVEKLLDLLSSQQLESCSGTNRFAEAIYNLSLSGSKKKIFVDKTPRYYHAMEFIHTSYPAAKTVILKRNPLDVALSYKTTWNVHVDELVGDVLTANTLDFAKGLYDLDRYSAVISANLHVVFYEELVSDSRAVLERLCDFLAIEFSPQMLDYHRNTELLAAQRKSPVGDRKILDAGRKTDTSSLGNWRQKLTRDEVSRLVSFLGGDIFSRLGYQRTLDEIVEDRIKLPIERDAEIWRSMTLDSVQKKLGTWSALGSWAYFITCATDDPGQVGEMLGLLFTRMNDTVSFIDSMGEATLDLAQRYRHSEQDRAKRLGVIDDLTNALKKASDERAAHLGAIDDLTNALKKASGERAAHLDAIDDLTNALKKVSDERAAHLDAIDDLTNALKKASDERTAHLGAIDDLTSALKKANDERTAHLSAIDDLIQALKNSSEERDVLRAICRRLPVRIVTRLFGIAHPESKT